MQRLFGFVLRDAFSEGRLSQLGCREANMGLHIRQGSDEGRKTTFHAGSTLIVCNGIFLLQASKTGSIVVALILLSEIISHMLNKIAYLYIMYFVVQFHT